LSNPHEVATQSVEDGIPTQSVGTSILLVWWLIVTIPAAAAPPTLTTLFPAGGQQGKTVEVTASGSLPGPVTFWTDSKSIEIKPAKDNGKFTFAIAPDAATGTHWLRMFNADGASEQRPFIVGSLPEILEVEPNDDPRKPQLLTAGNVVVNGRLGAANDVDHFALELKKGQTLVASLEANYVLRSPMDAVMQLLSADGFVLAENHDVHGLDPQIVYPVARDGKYIVRVYAFPSQPDTTIRFSGGDAYVYRLTLTTGGFADHAFPLAISLKEPRPVELRGWNIPTSARNLVLKPDKITEHFPVRHAEVANPVEIRVEPHSCIAEIEPNDRMRPQQIEVPVTISGHIDPARDVDVFEFTAKKGQQFAIQVETRGIGSALDAVLKVTDGAGKVINELYDTTESGKADPKFNVGIPAEGKYRVEVHDLQYHGGERYYYRLRIFTPVPDFTLTVAADQFTLTGALEVPVTIERLAGHAHPIEIKAVDLPAGVVSAPVTADAKSKTVTLKFTAKDGQASGPFRIIGTSPGIVSSERPARAKLATFETTTDALFLTVKPAKK